MRKRQKQIKTLLLFSLFIILIFPSNATANDSDDESGKGRMNIQSDRIFQDDEKEAYETELDRVFPELFESEIETKFVEGQHKQQNTDSKLRRKIFKDQFQKNTFVDDMKTQVFTEDITSTKSTRENSDEEVASRSVSSIVFTGSVIIFIGIIIVGVISILRRRQV